MLLVESITKIGPALGYGIVFPYFGNTLYIGLYPTGYALLNRLKGRSLI
jgi:hypothetical protein